ncbi:glycerate kinase [Actinomyces bovis]|uniref:Glycerate kinase n=1 Tax=Actinomyces bovis TaxID=1658 RepID=A0ABY1VPV6_9ACTO|nr:glycerate kinase [Actinomyces bovis]SPT54149.1 glycerate kinase [Actinomyces bovis]VEG53597.1 glycerate kinase [Actinomyces israelii]
MRILLAPGALWPEPGGTPLAGSPQGLPAAAVATALAAGWRAARPADELTVLPLGDGAPGAVDTLPGWLIAERVQLAAQDPLGSSREVELAQLTAPAPADLSVLTDPSSGGEARTWYLDAASLTALPADRVEAGRQAREGSTRGLGLLLAQALETVGLGGTLIVGLTRTAVHDGGAGLLEALGGLTAARELLRGYSVILALADELALGGLNGAGAALREATSLDEVEAQVLDQRACAVAGRLVRAAKQEDSRLLPVLGQVSVALSASSWGTGAAGGAALALRLAGASAAPGARVFAWLTGLIPASRSQDLCITATGSLYTLAGAPACAVVGEQALTQAVPGVLVAGRCRSPRAELAEAGIVSVYELEALTDQDERLPWEELGAAELARLLKLLGERLARSWSR